MPAPTWCCSALIVLSNALVGAGVYPFVWIAARVLYGFAICALFIVAAELAERCRRQRIRGRVMAIFYVATSSASASARSCCSFVDLGNAEAPLVGIVFTALSILPVGMTRLSQPPAPVGASVAFAAAWRISPVGIAGMLAVGGLSMMIAGFAPIHATAKGFSQQRGGDAAVRHAARHAALPDPARLDLRPHRPPLRADRRRRCSSSRPGIAASRLDGSALVVMIAIYIVWSGAANSIYSLSNAHANDRAGKDDLVTLSSTHAVRLVGRRASSCPASARC